MFRIINLSIHNFKGFEDMKIPLGKIRIILGGPNGYGKTTIFDALELLFTGKIQRMQDYCHGHDARILLNGDDKPLVYKPEIGNVVIEATIRLKDNSDIILRRFAEQRRLRNPLDFSAFSNLQYFNKAKNTFEDISTNNDLSSIFSSLANQYNFLNYLTQEEANRFLKCKESERKQKINSLFRTEVFDAPMACLLKTRDEVLEISQKLKEKIDGIEQDIKNFKSDTVYRDSNDADTEYFQLFTKEIDWDKENPNLSYEGFNHILSKDGILDQLQYYCKNAQTYLLYEYYNKINTIQDSNNLTKLVFWLKWRNHESIMIQYDKYVLGFRKRWEDLTLSTIFSFSLDIPSQLPEKLLDAEKLRQLKNQVALIKEAAESTGQLQRAYADLVRSRNMTEKTLVDIEEELHVTQCPLCGTEHNTEPALITRISEFGIQLNKNLNQITKGVTTSVQQLKMQINDSIIGPIDNFYRSMGINHELYDFYQKLDKEPLKEQYSFLTCALSFPKEMTNSEVEIQITNSIENWKAANPLVMPDNFNITLLRRVHSSYGRYLLHECLNEISIEKKRHYLTNIWNTASSKYLDKQNARMITLKAQCDKLDNRTKLLKQTVDKIKTQKNNYLKKMVSQIETLFYIYTGRIMQDNYYGRGCYLKYNSNKSNVLFTSGSTNNEVDALYKMSSGQLVSISVAFMLTINKLYANHHIIAIDDPAQTIDDLNLWGLMETLRHDFKDSTILLSTHERDFGILLTNKFNKMGLETEYVDMSQYHSFVIDASK